MPILGIVSGASRLFSVDYLVIAGGGGGGFDTGGGGGAGGYRTASGLSLILGSPFTVTVGSFGAAGTSNQGGDGGNSVFDTITSTGGGGGRGRGGGGGGARVRICWHYI